MGRLAHLFICGRRHAAEEAPPPYVATPEKLKSYGPTLVIHGGAGVITRERYVTVNLRHDTPNDPLALRKLKEKSIVLS